MILKNWENNGMETVEMINLTFNVKKKKNMQ